MYSRLYSIIIIVVIEYTIVFIYSQNLAPGVRMYFPSLPNSEVTLDHTLLPLATYPSVKQSRVQLDPQVLSIHCTVYVHVACTRIHMLGCTCMYMH